MGGVMGESFEDWYPKDRAKEYLKKIDELMK